MRQIEKLEKLVEVCKRLCVQYCGEDFMIMDRVCHEIDLAGLRACGKRELLKEVPERCLVAFNESDYMQSNGKQSDALLAVINAYIAGEQPTDTKVSSQAKDDTSVPESIAPQPSAPEPTEQTEPDTNAKCATCGHDYYLHHMGVAGKRRCVPECGCKDFIPEQPTAEKILIDATLEISEARKDFNTLDERPEQVITITRHGRPVFAVVKLNYLEVLQRPASIAQPTEQAGEIDKFAKAEEMATQALNTSKNPSPAFRLAQSVIELITALRKRGNS